MYKKPLWQNSVDPDQTAPIGAVRSGSMLLALKLNFVSNVRQLFAADDFSTGFYTKMNVWGSLGLNFEYDGGPIIEIGGPIFLYKLQILEGSISFSEGSVLSPGQ